MPTMQMTATQKTLHMNEDEYLLCILKFFSFSFVLGPAESLFKESYYELVKRALKPDGLLCSQGSHATFSLDALGGSI